VTAVGWDRDDDGCNGDCCTDTAPDLDAWIRQLPLATRIRLALARRIDRAGAWLCGHHCNRLAVWMWRACRML
jgi:hypothetical protein